ncbi:MAG: IclR family transcriptional regulator [Yoonia sp.]|uniref:IclR family transcriptional regulator n=1 Tax=Yoonia sp. TaxID=2212373 RepID=UPI003EF0DF06
MDGRDSPSIPTSLRMLAAIEEIARAGVPLTPTETNKRLGLPKPTVHRLFGTLEEEGFLQRDMDGKSYLPGWRLRSLAAGVLSSRGIKFARQLILRNLSAWIGETCNIAIPDGDAMIYLERVETDWPLRIQLPKGTRVPLHCTASGKMYLSTLTPEQLATYIKLSKLERRTANTITDQTAFLAEIDTVRSQGFSQDREEFMQDMIALAVGVHDPQGRLMATVSFHAPTMRLEAQHALSHLDALREAARDLANLTANATD